MASGAEPTLTAVGGGCPDGAVATMLEACGVAVVGASARPNSLGSRLVAGLERSPSRPELHLVNPRYDRIGSRACHPSLAAVPGPLDLVALAVGDARIEEQLLLAASRGDRSALVFGSAFGDGRRERIAAIAREAGMVLCGAGCMGFINPTVGLRVVGYVEPDPLPVGPVALVTHSGSAFSALLRADRRIGWSLAVSSGQELVTTTAGYLEYALGAGRTEVLALLLETLRDAQRLRGVMAVAARAGVPTVLLAVGGSPGGRTMVEAHSGALAGDDATWEALCGATGAIRVRDLGEMTDTLELLCAGRRPRSRPGRALGRIAAVNDSGAERAHLVDVAERVGVSFAGLREGTVRRLAETLDDGLEPANPLDAWGTGADATTTFRTSLVALAEDPEVDLTLLCVDLVEDAERDDSYEEAVSGAWQDTTGPLAVLANLPSAVDRGAARRLRARGVPVLEGTESGLRAVRHLLGLRAAQLRASVEPAGVDVRRRDRWRTRLRTSEPLAQAEGLALLADYGLAVPPAVGVADPDEARRAAARVGYPVVLKTDEPGIAHKSDVGGVLAGIGDEAALDAGYRDLACRLGPRAIVMAVVPPAAELMLGMVRDPLLGPLLVVGAGGVDVELWGDRRVTLPPIDHDAARDLVDGLTVRRLLDGFRGRPGADVGALVDAIVAFSRLVEELGADLQAVEVNPLRCGRDGSVAADVLVLPAG